MLAVETEGIHCALQSCDVAVVIGAPDVYDLVKAALLELVAVVGDIGGKIGVEPVCAAQNIVLKLELFDVLGLLAGGKELVRKDLRGVQPQCAVLFIGKAGVCELLHGIGNIAAGMQARFEEPLVVFDAVARKIALHLRQVYRQSELGHHLVAFGGVELEPVVAVLFAEELCELFDIVAVIAVLGELYRVLALEELDAARLDAACKLFDLVAGVVDIELAPYVVACAREDGCKRIAQNAAARIAHVHGAGGVCGHELDHELFALADVAVAEAVALLGDVFENVGIPLAAHTEIHESGACDIDAFKPASVKLHVFNKRFRDLARRHAHKLCACHCVVCRIVAVCGVLGYLDAAVERKSGRQLALFRRGEVCLGNKLRDLLFCFLYHVCHIIYPLSF